MIENFDLLGVVVPSGVTALLVTSIINYRMHRNRIRAAANLEVFKQQQVNAEYRYTRLYEAYTNIEKKRDGRTIYTDDEIARIQADHYDMSHELDRSARLAKEIEAAYRIIRPLLDKKFRKNIERLMNESERFENSLLHINVSTTVQSGKVIFKAIVARNKIAATIVEAITDQMEDLTDLGPPRKQIG